MNVSKKGASAGTRNASDQMIMIGSILAPKRGNFHPPGLRAFVKGGDSVGS